MSDFLSCTLYQYCIILSLHQITLCDKLKNLLILKWGWFQDLNAIYFKGPLLLFKVVNKYCSLLDVLSHTLDDSLADCINHEVVLVLTLEDASWMKLKVWQGNILRKLKLVLRRKMKSILFAYSSLNKSHKMVFNLPITQSPYRNEDTLRQIE